MDIVFVSLDLHCATYTTYIILLAQKNVISAGFWAIIFQILIGYLWKMLWICAKMEFDCERMLVSCMVLAFSLKTLICPIITQQMAMISTSRSDFSHQIPYPVQDCSALCVHLWQEWFQSKWFPALRICHPALPQLGRDNSVGQKKMKSCTHSMRGISQDRGRGCINCNRKIMCISMETQLWKKLEAWWPR